MPSVWTSSIAIRTHHDRAQHLAALHLVEGLLDAVERDRLGHEAVEVEPALQVQVDQHREVAAGQAVAVPAGLERAATAEELDHRDLRHRHVGGRHADLHDRAGQVAGEERLLEHRGVADGLDDDVRAQAAGGLAHALDRVARRGVDGVGGAEVRRHLELLRVQVDRDDRGRPGELGADDRGVADAAAAEHRHRVTPADLAGQHRRADAGHDAAAQQAGGRRRGCGVDLGGLARGDQRLLGEGADAERGGELGAVGQRHLLGRVVRREAVLRAPPATRPALAAHRPPVEDDEVARLDLGHVGSDRLDDAGGLVAQQERELVVDAALAVVQVGVAHAARLHRDDDLARARDRG